MASSAPDKLAVDVQTTRKHWYPKWILFKASPYSGDYLLAKRQSIGQAICDSAIDTGVEIAVPRDKQAVADAMHLINVQYPELKYTFHCLLATQAQDPRGWYIFLEAAAEKFARFYSFGDRMLEQEAVYIWSSYYSYNLQHNDITSSISGYVFFDALVAAHRVVRLWIQFFSI
jgi:hypothetical protein